MKKILFIIFSILLVCTFYAFSEETETLSSEVLSVNLEHDLFMITSGENIGAEMGDKVIVHRDKKKIAEGYIIGVKQDISAVEILTVGKNEQILTGDKVAILKKVKIAIEKKAEKPKSKPPKAEKPKIAKKPQSKWATLGRKTTTSSETSPSKQIMSKWNTQYSSDGYVIQQQAKPIDININKDSQTVFSYARLVLRENGYLIASSNRAAGIILATKPLELSLMNELWADAMASIDHNIVASFDIKPAGASTDLTVSLFKEHSQKEKYIKGAVMTGSKYHNELKMLVSEIKKRSEY